MATQRQLQEHIHTLATILQRYGASLPAPELERYSAHSLGFSITAALPGSDTPRPATISLAELWEPDPAAGYRRREYIYEFNEYPLHRRRAFHGHDSDYFAREFRVLVHEHCEEEIGSPECDHYFGLPIDAYGAIDAFARVWGQPRALGCADLRCMQ